MLWDWFDHFTHGDPFNKFLFWALLAIVAILLARWLRDAGSA